MAREEVTYTDHDGADPIRACRRKKAYPSEGVARLAIGTIRRVNPEADVRPYACRNCGHWHVGGTPRGQRPEGDLSESGDFERIRARMGLSKPPRRARSGQARSRLRQPRHPRHDPQEDE